MGASDLNRLPGNRHLGLGDSARYARLEFGDGSAAWLLQPTSCPDSEGPETEYTPETGWVESVRRVARRAAAFLL